MTSIFVINQFALFLLDYTKYIKENSILKKELFLLHNMENELNIWCESRIDFTRNDKEFLHKMLYNYHKTLSSI